MQSSLNRRSFLKHAAFASGAATLAGAGVAAQAIEPIRRIPGSKFKLSMAAYSYHNLLTASPPKLKLEDFIADSARMNLDGVELTSYYLPQNPTPEYLQQLAQRCFCEGLDISGTAVSNDFCHRAKADRDKQIASVKRWIEHAKILTAPVIRIFAGYPKDMTNEEAHKLVVPAIEECCDYAGQHGIMLALENHGGLTAKADDMLAVVRDVRSPWFGVNLDTFNFHSRDFYGELAKLAPYAVNVQVKVSVSGPDGQKRPADFHRLASIVQQAGYRGYIVLEYEEKGDPRKDCPAIIRKLRDAFQIEGPKADAKLG